MNVETPRRLTSPLGCRHGIWDAMRELLDCGQRQMPAELSLLLQRLDRAAPQR